VGITFHGVTPDQSLTGPGSTSAAESVSLVIPLYNSARFIDAALASVAGQTRRPDEVIVVDDASTDGGAARAQRWATILPLKVISQPVNQGVGVARRVGIAAGSGELVALLDADDVWFPNHLEVMLAAFREHGGLITADTLWWAPSRQLSRVSGRGRKRIPPPERQREGIFEHNFVHPICLFSRADYDRVGGFSDLRLMEDWDLWIRMVRAGVIVTMAPVPTALYRIHGASLSAGSATLATNVTTLPRYLTEFTDLTPRERRVLKRTIRRREARLVLLAGEEQAARGALGRACKLWLMAAMRDRRLQGGMTGARGSVTAHAFVNLVTVGLVGRMRRARAGSAGVGLRRR
jgi:GT2 family glycosyltransferase